MHKTGRTLKQVKKNMQEALEFHFEGLEEHVLPIPKPQASTVSLKISA